MRKTAQFERNNPLFLSNSCCKIILHKERTCEKKLFSYTISSNNRKVTDIAAQQLFLAWCLHILKRSFTSSISKTINKQKGEGVEILDFIRNTTKTLIQKRKGGVKMKRMFLITLFALLSVAAFYGLADAAVCSACHTMHNSQDGTPFDTDGANERLLKADCVACHTGSETSQTTSFSAPRVLADDNPPSDQGGTETNAGGDFYWVNQGSDSRGHNVIDLPGVTGVDSNIGITPPGWDDEATKGSYTWGNMAGGGAGAWASQLTCAGTYGCHGNHTDASSLAAIEGTHHNNATGQRSAPGTLGDSYRFLAGIEGFEDPDWNWGETQASHNEYAGALDTAVERDDDTTDAYANLDTISFFCAECHGHFHGRIGVDSAASLQSPWVRHPTDIELPNSGEYADYNPDDPSNNYNLDVPVARIGAAGSSSDSVTPGTDAVVMCLSCHRAHGSPEPDLLRFVYDQDSGGGGSQDGCFVCHTTKD
jgi:predicted CXXCH cytochrome family protein